MRLKRTAALTAAAATAIAGAFFIAALGPDISLEGFTRSPIPPATVDVDAASGTITCNVSLTSTNPIMDAGCTYASTSGIERSCSTTAHTGTSTNGTWSCNVTLQRHIEGGTWNLVRVFARDTTSPDQKMNITGSEILAAGDVAGEAGPISDISELQVTVTSTSPDTTPPAISATLGSPLSFYQVFGGELTCTNTVTDANPISDVGCALYPPSGKYAEQSCSSTTPVSGNDYACSIPIPPGALVGTWSVTAFARDEAGNRSFYPANETFTVDVGGFTWDFVASLQANGKGIPIRVALDGNGDAWINSEFHTTGLAKIVNATLTEDLNRTIPSQELIFSYGGNTSTTTTLAEGIAVDSDGFIWFSEGGEQWEASQPNHSRIGRYDPVLNSFRMYNLPGRRNVANGIWIDESRNPKWIWVAESGTNSDFILQTPQHQGSIIAFTEAAAWQNVLGPGSWATVTDPELCTGVETADDGCFQRFDLPAGTWAEGPPPSTGAYWPAHLVGDVNGDIWFTNFQGTSIGRLTPSTGDVDIYPAGNSSSGWILGSGPWDIAISPDGSRVAFTAYADATIYGFDWSRRNDPACQSLDGNGQNPCMTRIDPGLDTTWENTHSLVYDACGSLWFTTGFERTGGSPRALPFGNVFTTIGFVDPDWTHATLLDPTDYSPNPNTAGDISYHGIDFNPITGQIWTIQGPTGEPTKYGVKRWTPLETTCAQCVPDCTGLECGDNGCGGSCGDCTLYANSFCNAGTCDCTPRDGAWCTSQGYDCDNLDDACGSTVSCGACTGGETCNTETHQCEPPPSLPFASVHAGTGANSTNLYDACGDLFVPIGVNHHGHIPVPPDLDGSAFTEIAKSGANAVKIAWGTPSDAVHPGFSLAQLTTQVQSAIDAGLIPIIAMYDAIGTNDPAAVAAVVTWLTSEPQLSYFTGTDANGHQRSEYIILNVSVEPDFATPTAYRDAMVAAITNLRAAGYTFPLMIDANAWGSDETSLTAYEANFLAADPLDNLIMSWHGYNDVTEATLRAKMATLDTLTSPVVISEYTSFQPYNIVGSETAAYCGNPALYTRAMLQEAEARGFGRIPWAWGDDANGVNPGHFWNEDDNPNNPQCPNPGDHCGCWELDMAEYETCASLERWGCDAVFLDPNGIANKAVRPQYIADRCGTETPRATINPFTACGDSCATQSGFNCADPNTDDYRDGTWIVGDGLSDAVTTLTYDVWVWANDITAPDQGIWVAPATGSGPGGSPSSTACGGLPCWSETSMRVRFTGATTTTTVAVLNGTGVLGTEDDDSWSCSDDGGPITCPTMTQRAWHQFRFVADVPAHTYDVYYMATCADEPSDSQGSWVKIANDHNFATDSVAVNQPSSLRYWGAWGGGGNIRLKHMNWSASCAASCVGLSCGDDGCGGACPNLCAGSEVCYPNGTCCGPQTCADQLLECGNVSDTCGGVVDCDVEFGGDCNSRTPGSICDQVSHLCCPPDPIATTCGGAIECGYVVNNCGQNINCDPYTGGCSEPTPNCNENNICDAVNIVFESTEQTTTSPFGFTSRECEKPLGQSVTCGTNGVNVSRVTIATEGLPAHNGDTYAMKASVDLSNGGGRAQLGYWFTETGPLQTLMMSGDTIYVSMDVYFPTPLTLTNGAWFSFGDHHLVAAGGGAREDTRPGFLIADEYDVGSELMRIKSFFRTAPSSTAYSSAGLVIPTGRWVQLEWSWRNSNTNDVTIQFWVDGVLSLTHTGVTTNPNSRPLGEIYMKAYGDFADGTVSPNPVVFYRKRVRVADGRLTQQCTPDPIGTTCASPIECGTVDNNCGTPVDCTAYYGGCGAGTGCNEATNTCDPIGYVAVNTSTASGCSVSWSISPGVLQGTSDLPPTQVVDGNYTITWDDSDIDCLIPQNVPTPGQETLTVAGNTQTFDLSPYDYSLRSAASASVTVLQDGIDCPTPGCPTFGQWQTTSDAPFTSDYDSGPITGNASLPATLRDGRSYTVVFDPEPGYQAPSPQGFVADQATPQSVTGDYIGSALATRDIDPTTGWTYFADPQVANRVLYVSTAGNDACNGLYPTDQGSPNCPKATLASAWSSVVNGQEWHIKLRNGDTFTQSASFALNKSGPARTQPIWISQYADGTAGHTTNDDRPTINKTTGTAMWSVNADNVCVTDLIVQFTGTGGDEYTTTAGSSGILFEGIWYKDMLPSDINVGTVNDHALRRNVYSTSTTKNWAPHYRQGFNNYLFEENMMDPYYHNGTYSDHITYWNSNDNVTARGNLLVRCGETNGCWKFVQERSTPLLNPLWENNVIHMGANSGSGIDMSGNPGSDGATSPRYQNMIVRNNILYGMGMDTAAPHNNAETIVGPDFGDWDGGAIDGNVWVWGLRDQSQSAHAGNGNYLYQMVSAEGWCTTCDPVNFDNNVFVMQHEWDVCSDPLILSGWGNMKGTFNNNIFEGHCSLFNTAGYTSKTFNGNVYWSEGSANNWFPGFASCAAWKTATGDTTAQCLTGAPAFTERRTFEQYHEDVLGAVTGNYETMLNQARSRYNKRDWNKDVNGATVAHGVWSGTNMSAWLRAGYTLP